MDPNTGANPINNPKIDLLHQGGSTQQLNGAAGAYTAAPLMTQPVPAPAPPPAAPAPAPKAASDYVTAAQAHKPAPVPVPTPAAAPVTAPGPTSNYVDSAQAKRPVTPVAPPPAPGSAATAHMYSAASGEEQGGLRWGVIGGLVAAVLLLVGGGGYLFYSGTHKKTATAPTKTQAQQTTVSIGKAEGLVQTDGGGTTVTTGGTTEQKKIQFSFGVSGLTGSSSYTPEIELEPDGTAFTGAATSKGDAVIPGEGKTSFSVTADNLTAGKYHWQARATQGSSHGDWVTFGDKADTVAFEITAAPAAVASADVGSGSGTAAAAPVVSPAATPTTGGSATPQFAATGNNTTSTSIASLVAMVLAALGWLLTRRRRNAH